MAADPGRSPAAEAPAEVRVLAPDPQARLVQFENGRRTKSRSIGSDEIRIGRDPSSDWVVPYANVSRHHAVVRPQDGRNLLFDLGSSRGVRVNGDPIGVAPWPLSPGDVIELSDQVLLLYEEGPTTSRTPWLVTTLAMLVLLVATAGLYVSARPAAPNAKAPATRAPETPDDPGETPPTGPARTRSSGPESAEPGTHPRMPPATVPQAVEIQIDSLASRGGWYASAGVRSCGGPDHACGSSRRPQAAVARRTARRGEPG